MTADIVNLRRARKAKARKEAQVRAGENRARFGRTKSERETEKQSKSLTERRLEGHRRGPAADDEPPP